MILSAIGTVLMTIGFPALCGYLLYWKRQPANVNTDTAAWVMWLTEGYSTRCFFWDLLVFLRLFLVIVISLFAGEAEFVGHVSVLLASLFLVAILRPFEIDLIRYLELLFLLLCMALISLKRIPQEEEEFHLLVIYWGIFVFFGFVAVVAEVWNYFRNKILP